MIRRRSIHVGWPRLVAHANRAATRDTTPGIGKAFDRLGEWKKNDQVALGNVNPSGLILPKAINSKAALVRLTEWSTVFFWRFDGATSYQEYLSEKKLRVLFRYDMDVLATQTRTGRGPRGSG